MAIQDDIMAMLSQVSDAGDRATDRGRRGSTLYSDIAQRLSVDDRKKAMREISMLGDPMQFGSIEEQMQFDPLTGDRVATIIEKYMADAGDGVPDDMIVDDTRAAERMMEVLPSPNTAPRIPVGIEELPVSAPRIPVDVGQLPPPLPRPDFDPETAEDLIRGQDEGLAGLMAGQMAPIRNSDVEEFGVYQPGMARAMTVMDEMNRSPSTQRPEGMSQAQNEAFTRMMKAQMGNELFPRTGQSPEETFRVFMENDIDAIDRMDAQQGGPSGREFERRRGRMTEGGVNEGRALALGSAFIPMTAIPKLAAQAGISAGVVNRLINSGPAGIKRLTSMIRSKLTPIPNKTPGDSQTMRQRVPLAQGGAVRNNIINTYGRM